ncbi:zinc finger protein PLAGL1-like isoform X1 [Pleurodeles waltl]|uniref:zinc finger protein PLAGL1-like isoform X1 n=1 Tax=Pleurodeles waltl TaxID=8319 RepID=UPI00370981B5
MEISTVVIKEETDVCVLPPPFTTTPTDEWECPSRSILFSSTASLESHQCVNEGKISFMSPKLLGPMKAKVKNKVKLKEAELVTLVAHHQGGVSSSSSIKLSPSSSASEPTPSPKVAERGSAKSSMPRKRFSTHLEAYPCNFCGKIFSSFEKLTVHSYFHTGERPCRCPQQGCAKAFICKYKLMRHMDTHSPQQSHSCSYCDKTFHRKDHLKNHLQTHDPNKMSLSCEECGKKYNTKLGYKRHLALHAATSGDLTCRVCTKDFENTVILLEHLKTHAGKPSGGIKEKKHKCDHCDRHFYTRKDVRRHMVVHTGCKDFFCQFCDQRFGRKDHLTRHTKKTHSQELLKGRLENRDFQVFMDPISTFRLKEDDTMLHSFHDLNPVQSDIMEYSTVEYSGAHFNGKLSVESTHSLQSAAFTSRIHPLDKHLSNHSTSSTLPINSQKLLLNQYESIATSLTSKPTKEQPVILDSKAYNVNMIEELPLPLTCSPHKTNLEVSMQASSTSTDDSGEYTMQKDEGPVSETVAMSSQEIAHILGLWQLPTGGNQNVCVALPLPIENEQALHAGTFPGPQPLDLQIPLDGARLHQLQCYPHSFSSSSPALPHFHHAFK